MNERITELLKQCTVHGVPQLGIEDHVNIEKFAELVEAAAVAREREACAKLCEENMFFATGEQHAKAIRGRTE
jgi:hypothetical protein